jgi:hypothetical protein
MIKPRNESLKDYLKNLDSKTLLLACNDWKGEMYLDSNSNVTWMSVFGLNIASAGDYTLHQIVAGIGLFKYSQILLLGDHPCEVHERIMSNIYSNQNSLEFAKVLALTKTVLEKDKVIYSESLCSAMAYLRFQYDYLANFLNSYSFKKGFDIPQIKGIIFKNNYQVYELEEFELNNRQAN